MTLRVKLILALATIAAVATVIVGFVSYATTRGELEDAVDQQLRQAAQVLVPVVDNRPNLRPGRGLEGIVVQRIDADGTVRSSDAVELPVDEVELALATVDGRPGLGVYRSVEIDGVPYRMLTVRVEDGAIQLAKPTVEAQQALREIRNRTLLLVILVVIASAVAGWIIGTQLTRRLTRLSEAAAEVAATGNLEVDLPTDGVDETAQVASSLRTMLDALAASRAQQQQLIQDSGHELRTPLTSLRTNLQVLQRFDQLDPATRAAILADLDSEARELSVLVEEVLALATDRKVDEPVSTVPLAPIAERVAERSRRRSGREVLVHADGLAVVGRPGAIERAMSNLVDNAVKFAPGGTIELTVSSSGGFADISVRDHGPGIDEAEGLAIFDRFHRSVAARSTPGSGLGLAIVAATAEAHGGTVHAANAPDGGAVIGFRLPIDAGSATG